MRHRIKDIVLLARDGMRRKSFRLSLRLRLFAFLALFAAAIVLAISAILSASGVFSVGMNESRLLLQTELAHITEKVGDAYETLTVEGLTLSGRLSGRIDEILSEKGISASELVKHPELLTEVLRGCLDPAMNALEMNMTSGVFLVLDATANPEANSRAGIFIRNTEPNALRHSNPSTYYLRGPIVIARERGLNAIPQWLMEFPVSEGDFFHKAMEGADGSLPLSRTYYWNPAETLVGDYDEAMLLCVPLVATDGTVLGICGFEVNEMLFKMQYFPDTSAFSEATVVFAPVMEDGSLNTGAAMFSCTIPLQTDGRLSVSDYRQGLSLFSSGGSRYIGLSASVSLYSKNTAHSGEWRLAVLAPEEEITYYAAQKSGGLTMLLVILLVCAIGLAVFLSHRYLVPVIRGLEQIKRRGTAAFKPTNITEIKDLMDFLSEQDEARDAERQKLEAKLSKLGAEAEDARIVLPTREAFAAFLKNLETLTPGERRVFDLYRAGHRAKEMPDIIDCTMNAIKWHNKNIYGKLWVSSREELLGYIKMMKDEEEGKMDESDTAP